MTLDRQLNERGSYRDREEALAETAVAFCMKKCFHYNTPRCVGCKFITQRRRFPRFDFPLTIDDVAKCIRRHVRRRRKMLGLLRKRILQ